MMFGNNKTKRLEETIREYEEHVNTLKRENDRLRKQNVKLTDN